MTGPPEPSLALLAIRMIGRLRSHHVERLAGFRLSIPEANVLLHLQPGEPMTMRHLAEVMGYDKSNLTGVMGKLEARGLVARNGSPADRRTRSMLLTVTGEELREMIDADLTRGTPLLTGLSPADQAELDRLLRKMDATGSTDPGSP